MGTIREAHVGVVTDNADPEKRGRLLIACASLLGVDDNGEAVEFGDWIEPAFPCLTSEDGERANGGWFFVPSVGVTVTFEVSVSADHDETPGQTFTTNPDPRWVACLLQEGDAIADEFKTNYPARAGFRSASGHILFFDDSDGANGRVVLSQRANADGAASFIAIDGDGSIQIVTSAGHLIFLNTKDNEITILDTNKNLVALKKDGITVVDGVNGHSIDLGKAGVQVLAKGVLTLQGDTVVLGDPATAIPVIVGAAPPGAPSTRVFASPA